MSTDAKTWLQKIQALEIKEEIGILNVCGGHERAITQAGLRTLLPENIHLIPGPGCPVCVCPEEDIHQAIQLALYEEITLIAFGDLLRVPVNVKKSEPNSLEQAKAQGADIRPIASPLEAIQIAKANPDKKIVFLAAGFETTMAPVAAMLLQGIPDNLFMLISGRLTYPAVKLLLNDQPAFQALIAPGHVATIMGALEWAFVVEDYTMPAAVAGFNPDSILAAIYSILRQLKEKYVFLDNCYPELVLDEGNLKAQDLLTEVFDIYDANWRGIGIIPKSGFALNKSYDKYNILNYYKNYEEEHRKRKGEMPPGCDCANVVLGKVKPNKCKLYGNACTPETPIGPCMVSDEGACHIWWMAGYRAV